MNEQDHLNTLSEIKQLMERSSRFLSLSGLSSILIGIYALAGVGAAYWYLDSQSMDAGRYFTQFSASSFEQFKTLIPFFIGDALLVLILSIITTYLFTQRLSMKQGVKHWDPAAKRLLLNLCIPLVTGGLYSWLLIQHQRIDLILSSMLIFYGMALLNASHHTRTEIRHLGILEVLLGLLAALYSDYGLLFWAIGFGGLHIVYGFLFYFKYER